MSGEVIRVMYVDDDPDDRYLFETALNLTGYNVDLTLLPDGIQLIEILKKNNFNYHLLFLDLNMPVKSGIELLRDIEDLNEEHQLKIIILSTSDNHADIQTTHSLNATLYIKKPNGFDELVNSLKDILLNKDRLEIPASLKTFRYYSKHV